MGSRSFLRYFLNQLGHSVIEGKYADCETVVGLKLDLCIESFGRVHHFLEKQLEITCIKFEEVVVFLTVNFDENTSLANFK